MISSESGNHISSVLIIGYNRVGLIRQAIEATIENFSGEILVAIDGPKNSQDRIKNNEIRNYVEQLLKQKKIKKILMRQNNFGCAVGVFSSIDWAINEIATGNLIVLEDDCIPSKEFFDYVDYNLVNKPAIGAYIISGQSPIPTIKTSICSYPMIHGWSIDKNIWRSIRDDFFSVNILKLLSNNFKIPLYEKIYWFRRAKGILNFKEDNWDVFLVLQFLMRGIKCVVPSKNLVRNVGYGEDATHSKNPPRNRSLNCLIPEFLIDQKIRREFYKINYANLLYLFIPYYFKLKTSTLRNFKSELDKEHLDRVILDSCV